MMGYKKLIKSRSLRLKILRLLSFIPDKQMVQLQYRIKTGRKLNLKNPKRFSEKLQWYKLNYKNPVMIKCVDKYDVREYVKSKGLKDILIPCIGVYNRFKDINWSDLPDKFVIKDTLGGGGSSVIVVDDKCSVDIDDICRRTSEWVTIKARRKDGGREWPYYSGKNHRIIIEKYLESDPNQGGLIDYKFFCFDGIPYYLYVIADREMGNGAALGVYDSDFKKIEAYRSDERRLHREILKPINFDVMKEIAGILSAGFPEARIDLYEVDGKVWFGEITFFDGSGYMKFDPDEFDIKLGEIFKIDGKVLK